MSIPSFCPRRSCFVLCPSGVSDSPMVWRTCVENVLIRRWCGLQELVWNFVIQTKPQKLVSPSLCFEDWGKSTLWHAKVDGENFRAFLHCKNSTPWCIAGIELNKSFWDLRSPLLGTQALWGTLSSTLRFECTSDASTSHKKTGGKMRPMRWWKGGLFHAALPRFSWQC